MRSGWTRFWAEKEEKPPKSATAVVKGLELFVPLAGLIDIKKEIEAELTAENEWMDLVEIIASSTLRDTCNSWYVGANVPGKKRVFMPYAGGYQTYREKCDEIAKTNYQGFKIS